MLEYLLSQLVIVTLTSLSLSFLISKIWELIQFPFKVVVRIKTHVSSPPRKLI